ncbi:MAG: hypothetical protein GEV04_23725 [Actinophytocola sp.]|nr:hypothetical protein [Actinophytocola sp.]
MSSRPRPTSAELGRPTLPPPAGDAVRELPWLPNGPIPLDVTWTRPGYVPTSERFEAGSSV